MNHLPSKPPNTIRSVAFAISLLLSACGSSKQPVEPAFMPDTSEDMYYDELEAVQNSSALDGLKADAKALAFVRQAWQKCKLVLGRQSSSDNPVTLFIATDRNDMPLSDAQEECLTQVRVNGCTFIDANNLDNIGQCEHGATK